VADMRTSHLAADDSPMPNTLCGEDWEDWQDPEQGASLEETLAVPGLTMREKADIRAAERRKTEGSVRQCQACFKRAREMA
jgi:hypothetical protein